MTEFKTRKRDKQVFPTGKGKEYRKDYSSDRYVVKKEDWADYSYVIIDTKKGKDWSVERFKTKQSAEKSADDLNTGKQVIEEREKWAGTPATQSVRKGSWNYEVLGALSDGKEHSSSDIREESGLNEAMRDSEYPDRASYKLGGMMPSLRKGGLVERTGHGKYQITSKGKQAYQDAKNRRRPIVVTDRLNYERLKRKGVNVTLRETVPAMRDR